MFVECEGNNTVAALKLSVKKEILGVSLFFYY